MPNHIGHMVVGEPITKGIRNPPYLVPAGSEFLARAVLADMARTPGEAERRLALEYLALVYALRKTGHPFRFLFAHPEAVNMQIAGLLTALGLRGLAMNKNYPVPVTAFPRDFACELPGAFLANRAAMTTLVEELGGKAFIGSFLGEGGRTLTCGHLALVPNKRVDEDGTVRPMEDISEISRCGRVRIGYLPLAGCSWIDATGRYLARGKPVNDHLDRVACLLLDQRGRPHLLVDPEYYRFSQRSGMLNSCLIDTTCLELGIELHVLSRLTVMCSLNLEQFDDGKVLMTGGDEEVHELVGALVGKATVIQTEIPICAYPLFKGAGVRCLIGYLPPMPIQHGG